MRYIRPKSLTWWSGVLAIGTGLALMVVPDSFFLSEFGKLLTMFAGSGDNSPAALVFMGSGLIGLGDKFERAMRGQADA
jgi:hypothetical protein